MRRKISILLAALLFLFALFFTKRQISEREAAICMSSAKQIFFWIESFSEDKSRRPKDLEELFDHVSRESGASTDEVIRALKTGEVFYDYDSGPNDVMIQWNVNRFLKIFISSEGRVWTGKGP